MRVEQSVEHADRTGTLLERYVDAGEIARVAASALAATFQASLGYLA